MIECQSRYFELLGRDIFALFVRPEDISALRDDPGIAQICAPVWDVTSNRAAGNGAALDCSEWFLMLAHAIYILAEEQLDVAIDGYRNLMKRELHESTGVGLGVALPHLYSFGVQAPGIAVILAPEGYEFRALDGEKTQVALLHVRDGAEYRFRTFAAALFRNDVFRRFFRQSTGTDDMLELLEEGAQEFRENGKF